MSRSATSVTSVSNRPFFCPLPPIDECIGGSGSNEKLIAELQAVTLALRLFGLAALPQVLRPRRHAVNMTNNLAIPNRTIRETER